MSSVRLLHGDCLDVMPTLPSGSVQMVFADLPYGCLDWHDWDKKVHLKELWKNLINCISPSSALIFTAVMRFAALLVTSNPEWFRYDFVWSKLRPSNFMHAGRRPLNYHEHILVFSKHAPMFCEQKLPEAARKYKEAKERTQQSAYSNPFYKKRFSTMRRTSQGQMHSKSILENMNRNSQEGRFHPTQKPIKLLEFLIRTYTNEGDTVLDPTAGSGTTAIAALRTGRNAICIEKDAKYYEIMCKRVAAEQAQRVLAI